MIITINDDKYNALYIYKNNKENEVDLNSRKGDSYTIIKGSDGYLYVCEKILDAEFEIINEETGLLNEKQEESVESSQQGEQSN
jgi:hypothetical protein